MVEKTGSERVCDEIIYFGHEPNRNKKLRLHIQ
jgi:hypothetical protein